MRSRSIEGDGIAAALEPGQMALYTQVTGAQVAVLADGLDGAKTLH